MIETNSYGVSKGPMLILVLFAISSLIIIDSLLTTILVVLRASAFAQPSSLSPLLSSSSIVRPPTLTIVTRVNNSGGGNAVAANFSQTITNTYQTPDGLTISYHFVKGSGIGLIINPQPGVFGILELKNETNSITRNYNATYSGDCTSAKSTAGDVYGHGVIDIGETKTCIVTNTFQK